MQASVVLLLILASHKAVSGGFKDIRMPGAKPLTEDKYLCTSIPITEEAYVRQYGAIADAGTAHHILLFGCEEPAQVKDMWECGSTCKGKSAIMFAWAKNADPTHLPKDVGYHIGGDSGINHLVMQVHYAKAMSPSDPADHSGLTLTVTDVRPKYTQGVLLLISGFADIPPHEKVFPINISCRYDGEKPIHPFAYRTHAHSLSTVISSYMKPAHDVQANWTLLGKGNPQWPQAFYPMTNTNIVISPNDYLVGQCVYDSTSRDTSTKIGSKHTDEMCNFYMMYYVEGEAKFQQCADNQLPDLASTMPSDSLVPLPPNPLLDEKAGGHHHHAPVAPQPVTGLTQEVQIENHIFPYLKEAHSWYNPPDSVEIKQIAGITTDSQGNIAVFHRGTNGWDESSFDSNNVYVNQQESPIKEKTILLLNDASQVIDSWGENLFFLPHGITTDETGSYWITDVALHQVMKFTPDDRKSPVLVLGKRFVPGSDEGSFCKPTDVAVADNGHFYVSDGYCNGRVIQFDANGHVIRMWGTASTTNHIRNQPSSQFFIAHSLSISELMNLICVADRQHQRVQCFDKEGHFRYTIKYDKPVYGVSFRPNSDKLVSVQSAVTDASSNEISILHLTSSSGEVMGNFSPIGEPFGGILHDLSVSSDGKAAYIAQLSPPKVWKFMININDGKDSSLHAAEVNEVDTQKKTSGSDTDTALTANQHKPIVSKDEQMDRDNGSNDSQKVPILVAVMLVVPIVSVLIILLGFKIYNSRMRKSVHGNFDMGSIFSSRPSPDRSGFSPLTAQEDHYTESEDEEDGVYEKKQILKH